MGAAQAAVADASAPCARAAVPARSRPRAMRRVSISGGLFNQLWTLQSLVRHAHDHELALTLPTFDSHLPANAMGDAKGATGALAPRRQPFAELFDVDCFALALAAHGVRVIEHAADANATVAGPSVRIAFRRYQKYLSATARGEAAASPLEDVVYRALRPSRRLLAHVSSFAQRRLAPMDGGAAARPAGMTGTQGDQGTAAAAGWPRYGCVHARVENDMRRWWFYVGRVRPLALPWIIKLVGSVDELRRTPAVFVAVGDDVRASDEAILKRGQTQWGARLVRRDDRSGGIFRRAANASGGANRTSLSSSGGSSGAAPLPPATLSSGALLSLPPLTYTEAAVVDATICRRASWLVGWTSSSFSATLAHYRHLDLNSSLRHDRRGARGRGGGDGGGEGNAGGGRAAHYYRYCAVGRHGTITREATTGRLAMHTCSDVVQTYARSTGEARKALGQKVEQVFAG